MEIESYLPEAKRRYDAVEARFKRDAELPGGVGAANVHFMPFDKLPRLNQLRIAEIVRDHYANTTDSGE